MAIALFVRRDVDAVDQRAQLAPDLVGHGLTRSERSDQRANPRAVRRNDVRMQRDDAACFVLADLRAQPIALGDALAQCLAHVGEVASTLGQRRHQPLDRRFRLPQVTSERLPGAHARAGLLLALVVVLADEQ